MFLLGRCLEITKIFKKRAIKVINIRQYINLTALTLLFDNESLLIQHWNESLRLDTLSLNLPCISESYPFSPCYN